MRVDPRFPEDEQPPGRPSPSDAVLLLRRALAHDREALLRLVNEADSLLAEWPAQGLRLRGYL